MTEKPKRVKKLLLVATVGLATLSVQGCNGGTSGNLMAPPDTGTHDAGTADAGTDAGPADAGADTGNTP